MLEKEVQGILVNEKYRIVSDGSRNIILQESYEKKLGKGKNAEGSGIYDFKDVGYFGASLRALSRRANHDDFLETFKDASEGQLFLEAVDKLITYLEEREQRIYEHMNNHITLQLAKVKDVNAKDE